MIDVKIDTSDLERVVRALDIGGMRQAVGVAVAEAARAQAAKYPPPSRKPQPFKSAKSRAFFFGVLVKQGRVPFRRTGQLGNRWIVEPKADGATLTNTAPYSDIVQGAKGQAAYHRGVWETDEAIAKRVEQSGEAQRVAEKVVETELRKAGLT